MNRVFWCLFLTFTFISGAAAQGTYQRKKIQPNFFVPEKETNRVEKLPPFPVWEEEVIIIKKKPKIEEDEIADIDYFNSLPPENVMYHSFEIVPHDQQPIQHYDQQAVRYDEPEIDISKILPDNPDDVFEDMLAETGAYKVRRSEYNKSLQALAEDGATPMTPTLAEDLGKMDSNAKIWVSPAFGIKE